MFSFGRGIAVLVLVFASTGNAASPTYSDGVKALLDGQCAPCHRVGGPAPFALTSYADAKAHARQMAQVTASRYMPPWPPALSSGPFIDQRRLTDDQIRTLREWADAGAPEGEPSAKVTTAAVGGEGEWRLGKPDLVLQAPAAFTLRANGADVFWNFVLRPNLAGPRYVRAIEIRPGDARLVHHANLLVDRLGASGRMESRLGEGFPGMDLKLGRSPLDPVSHFLFWKPGTIPYEEPAGMSWQLNPGNLLVINAHLQPSGKLEKVRPSIGLYFTDQRPQRFPVVLELDNDRALDIPSGARGFAVDDVFRLPADADLLAIYPHAHYIGSALTATAELADGMVRELIRIPRWDLSWQAVYRFRHPIRLPAGTLVRMHYVYDNSSRNGRNPYHPPRRIRAGNQATDEMAHLGLQLLPVGAGDRRRAFTEALARYRLAKDPADVSAHLSLGAILLSRLRAQEALPELRAAVRLDPRRPEAFDMTGAALQNLGRLIEAIAAYRQALAIAPDYASARYNLARALARMGDRAGALREMEKVRAAFPSDARLQVEYKELQGGPGAPAASQPLRR